MGCKEGDWPGAPKESLLPSQRLATVCSPTRMHSLPPERGEPSSTRVQDGFLDLGTKILNAKVLAARLRVAPLYPGYLGLEPWRCPGSPEPPSLAVESSDSVLGCTLSVRMAVPGVLTQTLGPVLEFRLHPQLGVGLVTVSCTALLRASLQDRSGPANLEAARCPQIQLHLPRSRGLGSGLRVWGGGEMTRKMPKGLLTKLWTVSAGELPTSALAHRSVDLITPRTLF